MLSVDRQTSFGFGVRSGTIKLHNQSVNQVQVFKNIFAEQAKELVDECEECSVCLMPLELDDDFNSRLRIVKSQIEHVTDLRKSQAEHEDGELPYQYYH